MKAAPAVSICFIITFLNTPVWAQFSEVLYQTLTISFGDSPKEPSAQHLEKLQKQFNLTEIDILKLQHLSEHDDTVFQKDTWAAFSQVTQLTVSSCKMETLPERALEGLQRLRNLQITDSHLKEVPADLLHYTPNLHTLQLSNTKLSELPDSVFENVSAIYNLDLHSNSLSELDWLRPLSTVVELLLSENKIAILKENIFDRMRDYLISLDLSVNNIVHVDVHVFDKLRRMIYLKLSKAFGAQVTSLQATMFAQMIQLEELALDGNYLEHLPADIFHHNPSLKKLQLNNNKLTSLSDAIFEKNTKLQFLYLNDNQLTSLSGNVFSHLPKLLELNLENNQLREMDASVFSQLTALRTLWISNNAVNMAGPYANKSNLFNCSQIKNIHADNNAIEFMYNDWVQENKQLEVIDLRFNPVSEKMSPPSFASNHITFQLTNDNSTDVKLTKKVLLQMNEYADKRYILDKDSRCGSNCSCVIYLNETIHEILIKCVRFDENEVESQIPPHIVKFSSTNNMILDLSNSSLTSLYPLKNWLHQINFTKLSLSSNQLSHLDGLPELPRLKVLELDNNEFTQLDAKTLGILKRASALQEITLHNNPWICECSTNEFLEFVRNQNLLKKIQKADEITCDNLDGQLIVNATSLELCNKYIFKRAGRPNVRLLISRY